MKIMNSLSLAIVILFLFIMLNVATTRSQSETTTIIDLPNPEICPLANSCGTCCEQGAYTMFLEIDGIEGESIAMDHEKWIDLLSYDHSVNAEGSRRAMHSFFFGKKLDKASPLLALAVNTGEHFKEVTLEICESSGDKFCYMKYKLTDVVFNSYSVMGTGCNCEGRPTERISMTYGKIEWQYKKMGDVGAPDEVTTTGWNLKKNVKV